jgi:hypothetical protein
MVGGGDDLTASYKCISFQIGTLQPIYENNHVVNSALELLYRKLAKGKSTVLPQADSAMAIEFWALDLWLVTSGDEGRSPRDRLMFKRPDLFIVWRNAVRKAYELRG